jgi:AAA domain
MAQITYDVRDAPHVVEGTSGYPIFIERMDSGQHHRDCRWPLYSADELGSFRPVEWLIPNWLAAGELTVLYGKGDTYKSFIALTWACQLAAAGQTIIYIAAEGMSGLRSRIAAWQVHNRVRSLPSLLVTEANLALHQPQSVTAWQAEIAEQLAERSLAHPALVVVDTVARNFVGGDENSARDMGALVEGCEAIRKELGTAVLPVHHTRKSDQIERGTESLRNASFAMLRTAQPKKLSHRGAQIQLSCDRMKDAETPQPVNLAFDHVPLPQLSDGGKELVSSLAMSEPFPPVSALGRDARDDFLDAAIHTLKDQRGKLGMDKLTEGVRRRGVHIGTEDARTLLKGYVADDGIAICHGDGGYYLEGEA